MESRELSNRNSISEELARCELEAMERDARPRNQRQARDAVNQAVQESSASYGVLMTQEVQNRFAGRMDENERRVAQMVGSEAREAFPGQRNHMLQEQLTHRTLSKTLVWTRSFVKVHFPKFSNLEHKEAKLRVQLKNLESALRSAMSQENTACAFREKRSNNTHKRVGGAKHTRE